jgi:iron complex outermembrane receptor protein
VDVRPVPWWRSTANYSYLRIELTKKPGSNDVSQERRNEGLSPRHQAQLSSSIDVPGGWSFDWTLRYVSELPAGPVPEYVTSNLRAGWQISPHLELAVVGRDLHHAHHLEWAGGGRNVEIQRSGYVQLTLRR